MNDKTNACNACAADQFTRANTKFIHQRRRDERHLTEPDSKGGRTIGYSQLAPGRIAYAIANVHPNDRYIKEEGRKVALAKMNAAAGIFLGTTLEFHEAMAAARYGAQMTIVTINPRYLTKARA